MSLPKELPTQDHYWFTDDELHARLGLPGRLPLLTRYMAVMWGFEHV